MSADKKLDRLRERAEDMTEAEYERAAAKLARSLGFTPEQYEGAVTSMLERARAEGVDVLNFGALYRWMQGEVRKQVN